jgi:hypothetical protein
VGADRPQRTPGSRATINDDRAGAVLVSSADRPFKGDEETFNPTRPDASLDFDGGDRLELPALSSMLVEHLLELVAGHLAADHALAELDHRVLVAVRHGTTIVAAPAGRVPVLTGGLELSASAGIGRSPTRHAGRIDGAYRRLAWA